MHAMTKPAPPSTPNKHAALVAQACRRIEAAEQPPSLDDLARQAGLSPFHFHRVFKAATSARMRQLLRLSAAGPSSDAFRLGLPLRKMCVVEQAALARKLLEGPH